MVTEPDRVSKDYRKEDVQHVRQGYSTAVAAALLRDQSDRGRQTGR